MSILAIGFALYCLYDGFIGYPNKRERGFEDFKQFKLDEDSDQQKLSLAEFEATADEKRIEEWHEFSYGGGIPGRGDVIVQFVMAAGAGALGLFLFSIPLRARGTWVESTATGITSSWGQSFDFDQVVELNKQKWRSKGIAKVTYDDGQRKRRFVLDDYKFDRNATDAILYELEQRIGPEQITGGPPEPPPEAHAAEATDSEAPHTGSDSG
jgi:hypothetical protein